ncbi:hypothetical protein M3650_03460 [Paenibacillus sp. MER TA 81-3]|uniref:hypothetical protein n=1 Tax=Paenibacillus sp. MER TA 81-3 TaxID=2939573 RepID=UPI00203FA80A|nr:hypothetical protein [Paenibacillus sp. MER TA 81-3]MCM3337720.1 hypothetical protein [Paenibacillus sp. MER TA 81-3]
MRDSGSGDFSAYDVNYPLVAGFHETFHAPLEAGELQFDIPGPVGTGRCKRIRINDAVEMHCNDMTLNEIRKLKA